MKRFRACFVVVAAVAFRRRRLYFPHCISYYIIDKEYAGHDITLAIGLMKTDEQWLDRFCKMEEKWVKDAEGWVEYMESKYPVCGTLENWYDKETGEKLEKPYENHPDWKELTKEEKEALDKCIIM